MTETDQHILCGKCRVAIEGPADANPQTVFSCPSCGESDTFENIEREVASFANQEFAHHADAVLAEAAEGQEFLKVTLDAPPKRSHRFIVEMNF